MDGWWSGNFWLWDGRDMDDSERDGLFRNVGNDKIGRIKVMLWKD